MALARRSRSEEGWSIPPYAPPAASFGLTAAADGRVHKGRVRLAMNDVVPFVESSEQNPTEMNRPDAVVHLLQADGVLLQRIGNEEQFLLEPERPGVRDALHEEVSGILNGRQRS